MPYRPKRPRNLKRPKTSDPEEAEESRKGHQPADLAESSASPPAGDIAQGQHSTSSAPHRDVTVPGQPDATTSSPTGSDAPAAVWTGPLIGYCFCKDWKVTIKEPIPGVVVCHCKDCQAISSSFFCTFLTVSMVTLQFCILTARLALFVRRAHFVHHELNLQLQLTESRALLMVEPTDRESRNVESSTYYYTIKTGDNTGRSQSRTFCKRCGTVLFATPESLEGALPVNRNLFVGPHNDLSPSLRELLTPKIEIFTKDRSAWRPGQEGVLHQYISMPVGFGDSGDSTEQETNPAVVAGDLHL
ncbi:hypothetical protein TWF694_011224 [Orbilia ellipsospora]|uniref:CENP-V/GFA domain-containing protein n=1 Tax=Orbilia ellipsospora TaxID=2528407 RepID=A0AAV9X8D8_9PEZI